MTTGSNAGYFTHVTGQGERWDLIAWRYYRDADKQSVIIQANRDLFVDPIRPIPAILPMGLTLKIPVIEQSLDETMLPPWKRGAPRPGSQEAIARGSSS